MGFRFRRSIRIAPGLRINLGKKGVSLSAGVRGASVTVGPRGVYSNVGIPGTGLSYRERLDSPSNTSRSETQQRLSDGVSKYLEEAQVAQKTSVQIILHDDGNITFLKPSGEPLSKSEVKLLWDQKSDTVRDWLISETDKINGDVELLTLIHKDTPSPDEELEYQVISFGKEPPKLPDSPKDATKPIQNILSKLGFFSGLFKKNRIAHEQKQNKIDDDYKQELVSWENSEKEKQNQYQAQIERYQVDKKQWEEAMKAHDASEQVNKEKFPSLLRNDEDTMNRALEMALDSISWPRETMVSYHIIDSGRIVWIDVDLPEIEDLPQKVASISATGKKLNIKDKSQKQLLEEYAMHIHGIAFRLAGTVFATLPTSQAAIISGYTQRLDKATGRTNDDYLYSIKVDRERFSKLNFSSIDKINPVESMGMFEIQRKMTAAYLFKAIEPFQPELS